MVYNDGSKTKRKTLLIIAFLLSVCSVTYLLSSFALLSINDIVPEGSTGPKALVVFKPSSRLNGFHNVSKRCRGGSKWCEDVQSALKAVHDSQNPEDCSKAKFFVYEEWPFGLGSTMGVKSAALACAVTHQRVLVVLNGKHPEGWSSCPLESMDCVFMPLTTCSREDVLRGATPDTLPTWGSLHSNQEEFNKTRVVVLGAPINFGCNSLVPAIPGNKGYETLWWRGVSLRYLMRMNKDAEAYVASIRQSLSVPSPRIAMHVRRTDKVSGAVEMDVVQLSTYMNIAKTLQQAYHVDNIFINTDEPAILEEALANNTYSSFKFFFQPPKCGGPSVRFSNDPALKLNCSFATLADLFLAADSDYFIGTLQSNYSMLINCFQRTNGRGGNNFIDVTGMEESFVRTKKKRRSVLYSK
mmetsp:Transcript_41749/g.69555  ORF Transcript_41749/g.69555 Transcript_41749/m.69555 type:complete len:412 (+) Transcript_41749:85-1320(+)